MKRKYLIKKRARNNEFSALSGIEAVKVLNGKNCIVTNQKTASKGISITRYAYLLYTDHKGIFNPNIKVFPICGILNCVARDHLQAEYNPTKQDKEYINDNIKIAGIEQLAHVLGVPQSLLEEYLKSL